MASQPSKGQKVLYAPPLLAETAALIQSLGLGGLTSSLKFAPLGLLANVVDPSRQVPVVDGGRIRNTPESEAGRKARYRAFLGEVVSHSAHFHAFHRASREVWSRIAIEASKKARHTERQTIREEDRRERDRIRALKANDMASYKSLLEGKKQERLQFLIEQTEMYLRKLSSLIAKQQESNEAQDRQVRRARCVVSMTF